MCSKTIGIVVTMVVLALVTGAVAQEPDPSMLGWWKLDEGAGDIAADSSGRNNHGMIFNLNGGLGDGGSMWNRDSERGIVASFNGDDAAGAYIDSGITIPPMSLTNDFTWAFWGKQQGDGTGVNQTILGNRYGGTASPLQFIKFTPTKFEFYNDDTAYTDSITYPVAIPDGVWVHHATVKQGATLTYYRNGQEVATSTPTKTIDANPFYMGGDPQGERWSGSLSDVRLYERALSAEEVKALVPPKLKAYKPQPEDGAVGVTTPLMQWTAGDTALFHNVYFGTTPDLTEADLAGPRQPFAMYYHIMGLQPGVTYYWRVDEVEPDMVTIHTGNVWSFTAMPVAAWAPDPVDGAEQLLLAPTLTWTPGQSATAHHLYFGSDRDAVAAGDAGTDMGTLTGLETTYQVVGPLEMDTTYYWRVDETDTGGAVHTGEVWSFTTIAPGPGGAVREWWTDVTGTTLDILRGDARFPDEPSGQELVALMEGPVDWSDNYGSRIYGWLYPQASGDYTFWLASDDQGELWLSTDADPANAALIAGVEGWVPSRDFFGTAGIPGTRQQSAPVALEAGQVYYIEALMNEGTGGDNLSVAWQGPGVPFGVIGADAVGPTAVYPVLAFAPSPADGAVDTIQSPILSWLAGQGATQHALYLGDDADAVANADTSTADIFRGQQAATSYNTGPLEWGKTYYWRVDENAAAAPGKVWSFTTADFLNVEDFESYDDDIEGGTTIYQTWIDGFENGTGATAGYLEAIGGTFCETTIVHDGRQSLPLDYNNIDPPYYSEVERTFDSTQDWTVNGVDTLTVYFRGSIGNGPAALYVAVEDAAGNVGVAVHPDPDAVLSVRWTEWAIPLSDLTVAGVNVAAVKKVYIGVGDRDNPTADGTGLIFIDDIRITKTP